MADFRVRGQRGFEIDCGAHTKTRLVFGIFDEGKKSIGWYMFSSVPQAKNSKLKSRDDCATTDVWVIDDPFATQTGEGKGKEFDKIGVDGLVADAKSPAAKMTLDTKTDKHRIYCSIDDLVTRSNGRVHLVFSLHKEYEPTMANIQISGTLFLLEPPDPFDEKKFEPDRGPQSKKAQIALNGAVL